MFERILVPLDGSPRAELILAQIARILRREDAEILLLRAVNIPASVDPIYREPALRIEREAALTYLHDVARRFNAAGAKVHARVAEGAPAEVILDVAAREGATLIAMTTHGRGGLARWAMGSVAEKVARAANIPLLLVRSFRRTPQGDLEPAAPAELPFGRILVPVDGSATSTAAIGPAEKLGLLYGSEALVLHVRAPYIPEGAILPGMEAAYPLLPPAPPLAAEDAVTEKAAERFRHAGLRARRLSVEGDAASAILDIAAAEQVDLIAMGTHGRSGFRRWALGSVAERVLRSTEAPLLLVRESGTRPPAPREAAEPVTETPLPMC
jgi:nucleotide-binding universal stress UspA family protein